MYRDPIGHRIKTINNLMRKTMDKKTGQRPDRATLMHCWIIGFVQDREDSGLDTFPKDIEKEFSINRSTTSEMLKLMCKKGMIEREEVEYDARLKKIVLTESSRNHNRQIEDKMKELLSDTQIEESRIASEVIIYADKICTDEETVRLKSHIRHMKEVLADGEGIGRKLDFIAQEMNREANTILSKANDLETSNLAIDLKTEIEKVREQIQNIE